MKIGNLNAAEPGAKAAKTADHHGETRPEKPVSFQREMRLQADGQREKFFDEMIEKIDRQGKLVARRVDIREFEQYRRLIRDFLSEVVSNGYEYSKSSAFEPRGRHRFLSTVKTIDEKLDALAKKVLEGQSGGIGLLEDIEDIRGLLLDIRG